ncbi:MAG: hydroxymethylglutaryl-CoA lyase [Dethiosulfovibrio peptidovorans]|nr:MAG: hydroxymethylglutaryl-CoA lyase [Dethiosulfovibrio peptidovorans]
MLFSALPDEVIICEVGPRDGLQNEKMLLSVEQKVSLIEGIVDAGAQCVEIGAFVHPKVVPSMADSDEVVKRLGEEPYGVEYRGLALNLRGVERAYEAGLTRVKVSVSASPTHSRQNSNASPEEVMVGFERCVAFCLEKGVGLSGAISTAFGYSVEGVIPLDSIYPIVDAYLNLGVSEISMSDTTGMAHPKQVYQYMSALINRYPSVTWTAHFHNTRGMALANIYAALNAGVSHFDSSFAGLGGCPFAPGASGNVATEDVVNMLETMGVKTGFNIDKVLAVARMVEGYVGHPGDSFMLKVCQR